LHGNLDGCLVRFAAYSTRTGIEDNLPARAHEPRYIAQEKVQPFDRSEDSGAVHHHQDRIERARFELSDVSESRVTRAAAPHDLHRIGQHVDSADIETTVLKVQGVNAGTGSDIQDAAAAKLQRNALEGKEIVGPTKEHGDGYLLVLAQAAVQYERGVGIARKVVTQSPSMQLPRV
jgi:hypothetical protein